MESQCTTVQTEVEFALVHPLAKLPRRGTSLSAGYDIYSVEGGEIPPQQNKAFSSGLKIRRISPNIFIQLFSRSGMGLKQNCLTILGTIDPDYEGEIKVVLHNQSPSVSVFIKPGDRISQMTFLPLINPKSLTLKESSVVTGTRGVGGFGSTDCDETFIVLEGCIGSGKTTLFEHLRRILCLRSDITFLQEPTDLFTEANFNGHRFDPLAQIYAGGPEDYVASQCFFIKLLATKFMNAPRNRFIITDRHLGSCGHFIEAKLNRKELGFYPYNYLQDYLTNAKQAVENCGHHKFSRKLIFFLDTPIIACLERIKRRQRSEEMGRNDEFWLDYNNQLRDSFLTEQDSSFTMVVCPTQEDVTNRILEVVGQAIKK